VVGWNFLTYSGGFGPRLFFEELAAALSRQIDHRGAGCVAEEHAGRAVAPVHEPGQQLDTHDEHLLSTRHGP
jgi:hypothetical protein